MLSKNKLNRLDENKNTPKSECKDENKLVIKNNSQVLRNESQVLRDKDKIKTKTKTKNKDKDKTKIKIKTNNKMNLINEIYIRLAKAKTKVINKIKSVHKQCVN